LYRIRWIYRHLPRNGVLLFFDVKPIFVKAYGGRRYSSAKELILHKQQKTRGKFYLFTLYEVNSGRTRWAYLPGKSSEYVCQFMRRVRNWYADKVVWVALDQDRAHPCKSRVTRRLMCELKLHWISLPKRSPDDNPVETIFSDVQMMILDNSNDPDARTMQKRISFYLCRRNCRCDPQIRIAYISDFNKN